jgi:hypothetical protein
VDGINTIEYDRSARHLTAMLRLRSPSGSVRPYGLAGLGVYALRQDGEDFFAPGLNLGAGLKFIRVMGRSASRQALVSTWRGDHLTIPWEETAFLLF